MKVIINSVITFLVQVGVDMKAPQPPQVGPLLILIVLRCLLSVAWSVKALTTIMHPILNPLLRIAEESVIRLFDSLRPPNSRSIGK